MKEFRFQIKIHLQFFSDLFVIVSVNIQTDY